MHIVDQSALAAHVENLLAKQKAKANAPGAYLSDYSDRDKKWDTRRDQGESIAELYDCDEFQNLASRMYKCANILEFAQTKPDEQTGEVKLKLASAMFCKVRHCPVCAWRKSLRNVAKFLARLPEIREQHPGAHWIFLTLTVRNCDPSELRGTIKAMNVAWKRMIQSKAWPALGFVRTTEVTRGKDGSAHPHFHALLMVPAGYFKGPKYIKQIDWALMWQAAMRLDYFPSVDVRKVKPKIKGQTIEAAVVETLKYGTKPADVIENPDFLYAVTEQLHKLRFVASGGTLAGVLKDDATNDEMIDTGASEEEGEERDETKKHLSFRWNPAKRRYKKLS